MRLEIKFEGDLAEQNKIPAYEGSKSLQGLTRSVLIVSNYLVEGRVRRKDFGVVPIDFNLVAHRPGSFETVYEILYGAALIGGPIVSAAAGNLLSEVLKTVYRRVSGQGDPQNVSREMQKLEEERPGDLAALVEAAEPAVRLGHNVINHGVINININSSAAPDEKEIAEFTPQTKRFMWENVINDGVRVKLFSIGSFNANQGTGRAFDVDEGRSVPFELVKEVDRATVDTLLSSISSYTRKRRLGDNLRSAVAVKYTSVDAPDGRLKKMRVLKARPEIEQL